MAKADQVIDKVESKLDDIEKLVDEISLMIMDCRKKQTIIKMAKVQRIFLNQMSSMNLTKKKKTNKRALWLKILNYTKVIQRSL